MHIVHREKIPSRLENMAFFFRIFFSLDNSTIKTEAITSIQSELAKISFKTKSDDHIRGDSWWKIDYVYIFKLV